MTNREKLKRIEALVEKRATEVSAKSARELLIKEGILTQAGSLARNYGGKATRKRERVVA